ncbi:MAG: family 43 glycosylhydrolase, partial [Oscillospiraceae bacterium]|nr:family 43 glycosylhydrolase [Oscillospiraceae bacterium]
MKKKMIAILCITAMLLIGCSGNDTASAQTTDTESTTANTTTSDITEDVTEELILESLNNGIVIDEASGNAYKTERNANPISGSVFCADPTAVEYEGRLYVYGTNDHQQSELDTTNDYDRINSLVVFSTDDMVNWVYHGRIPVKEIAPWVGTSWAPSIVSRVEDDGLTHFYLYFSYNGAGVGVLTSTDPVTGWTD